ncbi:MAG: twin-arginine translocation signal domain-containing protein [Burkholderiales bacterium]
MSTRMSRRKFLAAVGVGGAATAAVVASKTGTAPEQVAAKADGQQGKGYQLTAHVRRYYETTKV